MPLGLGISDQSGSYASLVESIIVTVIDYINGLTGHGNVSIENILLYGNLSITDNKINISNNLYIKWPDGLVNEIVDTDNITVNEKDILYVKKIASDKTTICKTTITEGTPNEPNNEYYMLGIYHDNKLYTIFNITDNGNSGITNVTNNNITSNNTNIKQYLGYQIVQHNDRVVLHELHNISVDKCIFTYSLYGIDGVRNFNMDVNNEGVVTCTAVNTEGETIPGYLKVWVWVDSSVIF